MKTRNKFFALVMSLLMVISMSTPALAAETSQVDATQPQTEEVQSIPIVIENDTIAPIKGGTEVTFAVGGEKYIDDCGYFPQFEMWVTGGSYDTKVEFWIHSADGHNYGPCGPVPADGSEGWKFSHISSENKGSWKFTASIVGDGNPAGLVCHVKQL